MRRIFFVIVVLFFSASLLAAPPKKKNLFHMVETGALSIYIENIDSTTAEINNAAFKKILADMLSARKSKSFKIVSAKEDAKISVSAKVTFFRYLEKDPVDQLASGSYGLIADALISQNYSQIEVQYTVNSLKDGRKLWSDKFKSSVTRSDMPQAESIQPVIEESVKRFIHLCFGKSKK